MRRLQNLYERALKSPEYLPRALTDYKPGELAYSILLKKFGSERVSSIEKVTGDQFIKSDLLFLKEKRYPSKQITDCKFNLSRSWIFPKFFEWL